VDLGAQIPLEVFDEGAGAPKVVGNGRQEI
jgi:hypothetical protein